MSARLVLIPSTVLKGERGDTEAEKLPAALPPAPPPSGGQPGVGGRGRSRKHRAAVDRVDTSLSRPRSSSSASSFGEARVCRRMEVVNSARRQLEEVIGRNNNNWLHWHMGKVYLIL